MSISAERIAAYLQRIGDALPAVTAVEAMPLGSGDHNDALLVNDMLVFRFARTPPARETLAREAVLLAALADRLPLAIPRPHYVTADFIGYERLPGEPLDAATLRALPQADREAIVAQLAAFLRALHTVPLDAVPEAARSRADTREEWADLYTRIRMRLFAFMRPDVRDAIAVRIEAYLGDAVHFAFVPALRHGDIGPGNVLYDPATARLSAILDFGSAGYGDPALDLASALLGPRGFGEDLVEPFAVTYPGVAELLPRARFYASTFALQAALHGAEYGDPDELCDGLAAYV
jgi:aminoglycoside 2''-phosphotransferase